MHLWNSIVMIQDKDRKNLILQAVTVVLLLAMTGFIFFMQVRFTFVLEDLDYTKSLVTGAGLKTLGDIFKNLPALMRGGGSTLSLAVLQTVLLLGEGFANVLNMIVILAIAFLVNRCSGARRGNMLFVALPLFLMFSLNSDWKYSYLWEFGLINYVLPALPFLIFLYLVIFELASPDRDERMAMLRAVLACVCAFLCSWQNAAFGLIAFCVSVLSIILSYSVLSVSGKPWLWMAGGSSLAGMLFYMFNSGNFKKESLMNGEYLAFSIFPAVVLALLILAVVLRCGGWLNVVHLLLVGVLCCCVAFRFILQAIPAFSVNGIQVATLLIAIILFCSLLRSFINEYKKVAIWGYALALCSFLYMVFTMLEDVGGIS